MEDTAPVTPARWEVTTGGSRYVLDLPAGVVTRFDLDPGDSEPGSAHVPLRDDGEQMTLWAVLDCRVGRPMFLLLATSGSGLIGTVRVTTNVRSCTLLSS